MSTPEYDPLTSAEEEWLLRRWKSTLNRVKENWDRLRKQYDRESLLRCACALERGRQVALSRGTIPKIAIDVDEERPK
jgi:hypothetical protein